MGKRKRQTSAEANDVEAIELAPTEPKKAKKSRKPKASSSTKPVEVVTVDDTEREERRQRKKQGNKERRKQKRLARLQEASKTKLIVAPQKHWLKDSDGVVVNTSPKESTLNGTTDAGAQADDIAKSDVVPVDRQVAPPTVAPKVKSIKSNGIHRADTNVAPRIKHASAVGQKSFTIPSASEKANPEDGLKRLNDFLGDSSGDESDVSSSDGRGNASDIGQSSTPKSLPVKVAGLQKSTAKVTKASEVEGESDAEARALSEIRVARERSSPDLRRQTLESHNENSMSDDRMVLDDNDDDDAPDRQDIEFIASRKIIPMRKPRNKVLQTIGAVAQGIFGYVGLSSQSKPLLNSDEDSCLTLEYSNSKSIDTALETSRTSTQALVSQEIVETRALQPPKEGLLIDEQIFGDEKNTAASSHPTPDPPKCRSILEELPCLKDQQIPEGKAENIEEPLSNSTQSRKKRKMTGVTSKHFSPVKPTIPGTRKAKKVSPTIDPTNDTTETVNNPIDSASIKSPNPQTLKPARLPKKRTGTKSEHFLPLDRVDIPSPTRRRGPPGISIAPIPPITAANFGIIQEKLWREPFWLLVAVTLLNKTTGRAAIPTFWTIRQTYPSVEDVAAAHQETLAGMIHNCGLFNQRSKSLIKLAKIWLENPPVRGRRYRTLHYPCKGDGKEFKASVAVEEDSENGSGALEIAHLPGCGRYAYDSWRIFCRDVLRGVATGFNGQGAEGAGFEPEWKRVLPDDKELRATVRWMWLREGFIWNHENGERRPVTQEEKERALKGEMYVPDDAERKFAANALGANLDTPTKPEILDKLGSRVV